MTVRILTGDCRTMLATLPDASVQMVCTSPPYFGLRRYMGDGDPNAHLEIGTEQTPDAYVAELVAVFREIRRVLADSGVVFLNLGDSYARTGGTDRTVCATARAGNTRNSMRAAGNRTSVAPAGLVDKQLLMIPARVALALQADGWVLRSDIIWAKPNPMPESCRDRPTSAHEHVFLLSKRASYFYDAQAICEPAVSDHPSGNGFKRDARETYKDQNGARGNDEQWTGVGGTRNARNWWVINPQPFSGAHFATMPSDLAERCVRAGSSERGQCPHCAAPWARVVERDGEIPQTERRRRLAEATLERSTSTGGVARSTLGAGCGGDVPRAGVLTTGWQPTCACPEHTPVPQTILDPFSGAGTTLMVASRLGRSAVGIELNPDYAALSERRIHDDCPLFSGLEAVACYSPR